VAVFTDEEDVYEVIGAIMAEAARHPQVGPRLAATGLVVQLHLRDPAAQMTIRLAEPLTVVPGADDPSADVTLHLPTDLLDRFLRGEYNLAIGVARGRVQAVGEVDRWLAILPEMRPLFPRYRAMVAARERERR
jgi:hypothetical protein